MKKIEITKIKIIELREEAIVDCINHWRHKNNLHKYYKGREELDYGLIVELAQNIFEEIEKLLKN